MKMMEVSRDPLTLTLTLFNTNPDPNPNPGAGVCGEVLPLQENSEITPDCRFLLVCDDDELIKASATNNPDICGTSLDLDQI